MFTDAWIDELWDAAVYEMAHREMMEKHMSKVILTMGSRQSVSKPLSVIAAAGLAVCGMFGAASAEDLPGVRNGKIGFVLTSFHWTVYSTEQKTECPKGFNDGPREQYAILFPKDGTKRNLVDTALAREAATWAPSLEPEQLVFLDPETTIAPGLNLDGKNDANDFTSPNGETGIDNNFYRVIGCIMDYRPGGSLYGFNNFFMREKNYQRTLFEVSNVDSLINDDDVTVTTYRALDPLSTDATGTEYVPYGTQRVDSRFGKQFITSFHGKIVNGVLITDPAEVRLPYNYAFQDRGFILMHGSVLKVKLTNEQASGYWGGFIDVETFYRSLIGALGTHTLSYGRQSAPSMYRAMHKFADGIPDPTTGKNRGISGSIDVTFKQTFIKRSDPAVASNESVPRAIVTAQGAEKAQR